MAIIRAVMRLGSSLGMITTAEGVETEQQLEIFRAEGCMQAQGYLFSRAKPASEIPAMLSRSARAFARREPFAALSPPWCEVHDAARRNPADCRRCFLSVFYGPPQSPAS